MPFAINTLHSYDTVYSADSVEWSPCDPYQHLFVCGTYQLSEGESSKSNSSQTIRKGRILLFGYESEHNDLQLKQTIETAAVLDQKWHPKAALLTAAKASGEVLLYALAPENEKLNLIDSVKITPDDPESDLLALSLDWTDKGDKMAISDSKGSISIVSFGEQALRHLHRWNAHSFEAWTCAFDSTDQNLLYTGGDDTLLCIFDIRCLNAPVGKMKNKSHSAGVTSLLSCRHQQHLLVTGSYDDHLRIFDTRFMKNCMTEKDMHGGLWRLKSNPVLAEQILCACMYHNFSVVTINKDHSISLDAEYNAHDSICYGCDWSYSASERGKLFATCSFYDHKLCVSVLEAEQ